VVARVAAALAGALALAVPAFAQAPERYVETVVLAPDGSARVAATVTLPRQETHALVPVPDTAKNVRAGEAASASATLVSRGDRRYVRIECLPCGEGRAIPLTYTVASWPGMSARLAHDNRRISYGIVNTTGDAIGMFEGTIVLPPGFAVTSVDSVDPPVTDATVALPYVISQREGRQAVTITERAIPAGDRVRVTARIAERGSLRVLLAVLMLTAVAYLVRFRDLTAIPKG